MNFMIENVQSSSLSTFYSGVNIKNFKHNFCQIESISMRLLVKRRTKNVLYLIFFFSSQVFRRRLIIIKKRTRNTRQKLPNFRILFVTWRKTSLVSRKKYKSVMIQFRTRYVKKCIYLVIMLVWTSLKCYIFLIFK